MAAAKAVVVVAAVVSIVVAARSSGMQHTDRCLLDDSLFIIAHL